MSIYTVRAMVEVEFEVEAGTEDTAYKAAYGAFAELLDGNGIDYSVDTMTVDELED